MRRWNGIGLLAALALWGCVEKEGSGQKKIDPAYIEENLLDAVPSSLDHRVDADLGGKVVYVGNDIDTNTITPGGEVRVVHYWKVVDPPGSEWRVFSHLVGSGGQWMNVDLTDMRIGHPPSKWKAGQIIRDEQKFTLKGDWSAPKATLGIGLYRKGGQGAADRMPIVSGPADAEQRVQAATFVVDLKGGAAAEKTEYAIRRANTPIEIDGVADEDAWKSAPKSRDFVSTEGGKKMKQATRARLLWDDEYLYAFVEVEDTDVHSQYEKKDEPMWKEDVVELFVDADGNRRGYVELQVNPNNAQFDAWFQTTRAQKSDVAWSAGMKSAVVIHGDESDREGEDEGWDVEIAIPLASVKGRDAAMKVNIPPKPGDRWRLNVVRGDKPEGGQLVASSWNPIPVQDFHALDRMLTVIFADESGAVAPAPEKSEEPAAAEDVPTEETAGTESDGSEAAARPRGRGTTSRTRELKLRTKKDEASRAKKSVSAPDRARRKLERAGAAAGRSQGAAELAAPPAAEK